MSGREWEVFLPKWFAPDVRWQGPGDAFVAFRADQFGCVRSMTCYRYDVTETFWSDLKNLVLPAARAAVPPVKGRYSYCGSILRNQYLEAVSRELNARKMFPVLR